ncbi:hypothetical protein ELE36_18030 [Pseudolysobacter antarcticus]|uniref:AI-2E family transporter n=1 Tax=Pseudolysobacter antarcticus TaxID=2511995 RepID=A0A411HNS7_9GAMM|nr:hypothetical protein [Pseudolysobacter antarcticus]QBB72112.1 hypothetical protein ELE36_18030 [Pseudolysobacter antarcticus]
MFNMVLDSMKLFLRGQLFRDNTTVLTLWLLGFVITVALIIGLVLYVSLWLGALLGGLLGGALMPYLFRNLKYN